MIRFVSKTMVAIISLTCSFSCNTNFTENSNKLPQKFLEELQGKTNDNILKNKNHMDSAVFVDSVMLILNEVIDPPQ
jgi:hypothetical protein